MKKKKLNTKLKTSKNKTQDKQKKQNKKVKEVKVEMVKVDIPKEDTREKRPNYVDPKVLNEEIINYYKTNNISDKLGEAIYNIANRIGFAPNFINYVYKEEMIGDAVIKMLTALKNKNFNPKLGNSFSYFSQIAFNAFKNRIKKEKKSYEVLRDYQEEVYSRMEEEGYIPRHKNSNHESNEDGDMQ